MSTFDDLIRYQPDNRFVRKSRDRYFTPSEAEAQFKKMRDGTDEPLRPGAQIVLNALRRKAEAAQAPGYRGTELLDRQTTFVDLLQANVRGLDVRQRDHLDEWAERLSDEEIADLLDTLDESEKSAKPTWSQMTQPGYIEKVLGE